MRTVDDFAAIRRAHRDGQSIREIARKLGVGRDTVRKALNHPEPQPYTLGRPPPSGRSVRSSTPSSTPTSRPRPNNVTPPASLPPPPRRVRLRRRLRSGSPLPEARRLDHRETFIPLAHTPGQRLEADFGHIHVDFPDGRRLVPVMVAAGRIPITRLPQPCPRSGPRLYSPAWWRRSSFLVACLARSGGTTPRPWSARSSRAASVAPNEYYAALASHYTFAPKFCMPARGNEKPRAEDACAGLQQQWATPVPRFADLDELNAYLRQRCVGELQRTVAGYTESIGQRFAHDQARRAAVAGASIRCLRDAAGGGGQVPDGAVRSQSLQRAASLGVPDRDREGLHRPRRDRGRGQVVARHARSYGREQLCSTRCTIW